MNAWRPYPLLRLAMPFLAGIIVEISAGSAAVSQAALLLLPAVLLLWVASARVIFSRYRLRWMAGMSVNLFLGVAGFAIASGHRLTNDPRFFGTRPDGLFIATIAEPPSEFRSGRKAILKISFYRNAGTWKSVTGRAMGYLKCSPGSQPLQYGDRIILRAGFERIADNSNPHTFSYSRYLENKGILHRVYAEPWAWRRISMEPSGHVQKFALNVRDRLLGILRENHIEGREFAVAAALLLGYVNDLDAETRRDYAASGAMHILSVSGMHVGIIYLFLEFMLGFMNRNRPGRLVKAVLILALIWFYALLTGLSPSVLRSAAMLSLPVIGKTMNRAPDMNNILAASVVFILAFDPFLLPDAGFQLSYLAVGGIIVLYKPIYDLYVTSSWLPDKIWSVLAVSLAAQIATLPLTFFLFHQFPTYFLLTNIVVVPLSSLIIYLGILVLAVGSIPAACAVAAKVLVFLVWLLNTIIHFIEQLPGSVIGGIYISVSGMLLLFLLITAIFLFLTLRRSVFLYAALAAAIILQSLVLEARISRLRTSSLVVFNTPREGLYLFGNQDKAVVIRRLAAGSRVSPGAPDHSAATAYMAATGIRYHRDYLLKGADCGQVPAGGFVPLTGRGCFFWFDGYRVALLSQPIPRGFRTSLAVDLLLISGNPKISIREAIDLFHPGQIVIDATIPRYKTLRWLQDASALGVQCHAVTEHGAFEKLFLKDLCSLIKLGYFCSTFEDR